MDFQGHVLRPFLMRVYPARVRIVRTYVPPEYLRMSSWVPTTHFIEVLLAIARRRYEICNGFPRPCFAAFFDGLLRTYFLMMKVARTYAALADLFLDFMKA